MQTSSQTLHREEQSIRPAANGNHSHSAHCCNTRDSEHFVQFYENDAFLVESVAAFIGEGLGGGKAAVVIATQAHREALEERLEAQGIDVKGVKARKQFMPLDAAETLGKFMVDGVPHPRLFAQTVGKLVAHAQTGYPGLRAFGEMVALLWAEGNGPAAIRLEQLWNDLSKEHVFSLFCAYPMAGFEGHTHGESFLHICGEHSRVIPTESFAAAQHTEDQRLMSVALLQQKAVSLESEVLERRRAEAELREARDKLAQANEELEIRVNERTAKLCEALSELEAFSYSVSHDMRGPLRAMQAHASALLDQHRKTLDPSGVLSLERIGRACTRLDMLVRDVLAYSKVSKQEIDLTPIALTPLIEDVIRDRFENASNRINWETCSGTVLAHEACLTQCIANLVDNALKFVPQGAVPTVHVRSERVGSKVKVSVSDNGVGIHRDHHDRIFQIFGRVYSEKVYEGNGIGLCIVKKAVTRMGGEAGFESEPGRGSNFWFTLQAAAA